MVLIFLYFPFFKKAKKKANLRGLPKKKVLASSYSPTLLNAVPSPHEFLTSVFGMGTGVTTQL